MEGKNARYVVVYAESGEVFCDWPDIYGLYKNKTDAQKGMKQLAKTYTMGWSKSSYTMEVDNDSIEITMDDADIHVIIRILIFDKQKILEKCA